MIIPVRCQSCGKPIGHLYEDYLAKVAKGESKGKAMDDVGLTRYCCRGVFLGHLDLIATVGQFKKA